MDRKTQIARFAATLPFPDLWSSGFVRAASTYSGGTAPALTGFPVMPSWAPKAPIQFSNYGCFNHRAPELSSGRRDHAGRGPTSRAGAQVESVLRNMVDAARLLRERLVSNRS